MIANALPSGVDETVIALNVILAGAACGFNAVVAARSASIGCILHTAISALAGGYAVAYVVLLSSNLAVQDWSSVMRGVSLVAWAIVWIGPAWIRLRSNIPDRFAEEVRRQLEQMS